jgi:hypothetical protein
MVRNCRVPKRCCGLCKRLASTTLEYTLKNIVMMCKAMCKELRLVVGVVRASLSLEPAKDSAELVGATTQVT